jgi:hypothetical protein
MSSFNPFAKSEGSKSVVGDKKKEDDLKSIAEEEQD